MRACIKERGQIDQQMIDVYVDEGSVRLGVCMHAYLGVCACVEDGQRKSERSKGRYGHAYVYVRVHVHAPCLHLCLGAHV